MRYVQLNTEEKKAVDETMRVFKMHELVRTDIEELPIVIATYMEVVGGPGRGIWFVDHSSPETLLRNFVGTICHHSLRRIGTNGSKHIDEFGELALDLIKIHGEDSPATDTPIVKPQPKVEVPSDDTEIIRQFGIKNQKFIQAERPHSSETQSEKKKSLMGPGSWLLIYLVGGFLLSNLLGPASWILMLFCVVVLFLIFKAQAREKEARGQ